ncbi:MAG: matrixin family metalloprotease [Actinotalea sp.]|nr:matrixin family metalloprotease [Actinotalea sp.]
MDPLSDTLGDPVHDPVVGPVHHPVRDPLVDPDDAAAEPAWPDAAPLVWYPPQRQSVIRMPFVVALFATLVAAVLWNAVAGASGLGGARETASVHGDVAPDVPARARPFRSPTAGVDEQPTRLLPAPLLPYERGTYAFLQVQRDGEPVTWSPCRPIRYVLNTAGAPDDFAEKVRAVADEVSAATGLVLLEDGTTAEAPTLGREPFQPERYGDRWAPVLIAFADERSIDVFDTAAGVASPQRVTVRGRAHYVSGAVYLHTDLLDTWRRPWSEAAWVAVLRHELGHLVGLDHVEDKDELMYPTAGHESRFGAGDLEGLAALGLGRCAPHL